MKKVELYRYDFFIFILTLGAFYFFLKSSDLQLWKSFSDSQGLLQFKTGNSIVLNFSMGFIVSYIFYVMNVFGPRINENRRNYRIVKKSIEIIINVFEEIFESVLENDSKKYIRNISREGLREKIKSFNPDDNYTTRDGSKSFIKKKNIYLGYKIIDRRIEYLLKISNVLQPEFIEIFYEYYDSGIKIEMELVPKSNKMFYRNYSDADKFLLDYHDMYKKIYNINMRYR